MNRDEAGRSTSIKKLKSRAREIRKAQNVPLAKALEIASREAGYQNYHEALKALDSKSELLDEKELDQASSTYGCIEAFLADDGRFDAMSKALMGTYYGRGSGLREFAVAYQASLNPDASAVLGQWIGTALNNAELEGPRFETNIALVLCAGEKAQRPLACVIDDAAALAAKLEDALRVRGARVALGPLAMLAGRVEDGKQLSEWLHIARNASSMAQAIAEGSVVLENKGNRPPSTGSSEGSCYVLFGRATAPMSSEEQLHAALSAASFDGISCVGETSEGCVELSAEDLGTADIVIPWLYADEVKSAASYVEYVLKEEGLKPERSRLGIQVWDGETPRRVDIVVHLPDDAGRVQRTRSTELGSYTFPTYLHLALQKEFGLMSYTLIR